jgi:hypothetical protein
MGLRCACKWNICNDLRESWQTFQLGTLTLFIAFRADLGVERMGNGFENVLVAPCPCINEEERRGRKEGKKPNQP